MFERRGTVASGSFANAGLVAPGYVAPWAAPGMPGKVARHLFAAHAPVRIAAPLDAATLGWAWRWWRACRPRSTAPTGLASSPRPVQPRATAASGDAAASRFRACAGLLVLLRSARELGVAEAGVRALAELASRLSSSTPRRAGDRAGPEPGDAASRRHLFEGRRGRQLSRVHAPAAQGSRARRRDLPLQRPRRADPCRQGAGIARPAGSARRARRGAALARHRRVADDATAGRGRPTEPSFDAIVVCAAVESRPL